MTVENPQSEIENPNSELPERILGIDPSLTCTGYAVIERTSRGPVLKEGGVVRSDADKTLAQRICEIAVGLREVIEQYQPKAVAIEQVYAMPDNPQTTIKMAHVRGAILMQAAEREIPVLDYSPREIKKLLTGSGRAGKEQVQFAVQRELGLKSILEPNDVADATAVALCLYHSVKFAA
ncbi:MAG: crossover junction endodeoxyribonuclease RuvC [Planctomycetaceae bacterium]|nr:crossover junction endodeoxyribonuclease RuvC [Planctomycetaceae bacterium]